MLTKKKIFRLFSTFLIITVLLTLVEPAYADHALLKEPARVFMQDDTTPTPTDEPAGIETPVPIETPIATETSEPTEIPIEEPTSAPAEMLAAEAGDVNALAVTLYVKASGGSDSNNCLSAALACATINGAIGKAAASGDTIKVATGTYTGAGTEVVLIDKSVTLSGGWNATFTSQIGMSIIDGESARRGVTVNSGVSVMMGYFTIQNGNVTGGGGGIHNSGTLTVANSVISNNNAGSGVGAGIHNAASGIVNLNNSIINQNGSDQICFIIDNLGTLTMNNSVVKDNNTTTRFCFPLIIMNSSGTMTLNNSTVANNSGFGLYNYATLVVNNSTISGNAGGIYNWDGVLTMNNATIMANISSETNTAGGIFSGGTGVVTMRNSILAGNTGTVAPDCSGNIGSSGYNLVGDNSGCTFSSTTGDKVGTGAIPIIPGLTPLQDNGGATFTHALMVGSPAINAGNPASPGSGGNACLAADQRGTSRPVSTACDIGAFEGQVAVVFFNISGNAGIAGAVLSYTEGTLKTVTADVNGNYSFQVPSGWSGTVTPSKAGYNFIPSSRTYNNVFTNQTAQNYTFDIVISGNVGTAGATLSYTDGTAKTAMSDINGNYSVTVSYGWSGTITPTKPGSIFTPIYMAYSNVTTHQTAQNYAVVVNLLLDPSFETYWSDQYWLQTSTNFGTPLCTMGVCGNGDGTASPHTGAAWGWFGGVPKNEVATLSQSVVFPTSHASLQFYFWIGEAAAGSNTADVFTAKIDDVTIFSANATQKNYPTYTLVTVDVSAFADGTSHVVKFSSVTTTQLVTFNLDDVFLFEPVYYTISGNAGTAGATLSYVDGTIKNVTADGSGLYSLEVPSGWSGTVTPSKIGYNFMPVSKTYGNVAADQISQNYTAVFDTTPPVVSSITRGNNNPTDAFNVNFLVTFSESVTGVEANDFTLTTTGVTGASISGVSGSGSTRTVTVKTGSGDGTIRLNLVDDNTVIDWVSNPLGGAGAGNGNFSGGEVYTIDKPDLPAPTLRSPRTGMVTNDVTPTFWWTKVKGGGSYMIQFATDALFTSGVNSQTVSETSYTVITPFVGGGYFWRVRAYNASNQPGEWSSTRSFSIDTSGPSAPVLSLPANSASTRSPTFRWGTVSGAVLYEFQYDNDSNLLSPTYTVTTRSTFRRPPAMGLGVYYWHVRAKDAAGNWGAWSAPFTINITSP